MVARKRDKLRLLKVALGQCTRLPGDARLIAAGWLVVRSDGTVAIGPRASLHV